MGKGCRGRYLWHAQHGAHVILEQALLLGAARHGVSVS